LEGNNPDVIIVSQAHIQLMAMLAIKLSRWKGKVILNEHSLISFNTKSKLQKLLMNMLFRYADAITAVSNTVADDFKLNFPSLKKKLSVIYNASFNEGILVKSREEIKSGPAVPLILAAGRLTASKNYRLLLDAFKLCHDRMNSRLIILGDGEMRSELESYAESLGLSNDVAFMGHVQNPYAYMTKCKVFVMTSDYEGLPTVLIEALACCCNIVCTKGAGGAHEILSEGKYGVIVDNDAQKLARAMADSSTITANCNEKLKRAMEFGTGHAVSKYVELINLIK
jgi:glycosyltransferase involved in cell wall biosynthesis